MTSTILFTFFDSVEGCDISADPVKNAEADAKLRGREVKCVCADAFSALAQSKADGANLVLVDPLWAGDDSAEDVQICAHRIARTRCSTGETGV